MSIGLLAIAVAVGFSIGAVGVGGVLLIPPLTLLAGVPIHEASATALFTFLFTGLYGTWLFQRQGSIHWRASLPVCGGALAFSYAGAWVNSLIGAGALNLTIALIIVFAGTYILLPISRGGPIQHGGLERGSPRQTAMLFCVGAVSGFGSGLSGAGGPLFSVPIMLLLGVAPLTAIGIGQVLQIVAASAGSLGNLQFGSINFGLAAWLSCAELLGVFGGVRFAHRARVEHLRAMVAWLCVIVGGWMLYKSLR